MIVEKGGKINIDGGGLGLAWYYLSPKIGISTTGDNNTVVNHGTITMRGTKDTRGVWVKGNNTTVTNNGTINMEGKGIDIYAVISTGKNNTFTNNGTINHAGYEDTAVWRFLKTVNGEKGTIATKQYRAMAMGSRINSAILTNEGLLKTEGVEAYGIYAGGHGITVVDRGGKVVGEGGRIVLNPDTGKAKLIVKNLAGEAIKFKKIVVDPDTRIATVVGSDGTTFGTVVRAAITNSGSITTAAKGASGIYATGWNTEIANSRTITTQGENAHGIYAEGDNTDIANSGTITTQGENAHGIYATFNGTVVVDSDGTVVGVLEVDPDTGKVTVVNLDETIFGTVVRTRTTNSGDITTTGDGAYGIYATGDNTTTTHSGTIVTKGENAHGIIAEGAGATITSSGAITTTGDRAHGIHLNNTGTITHSGTISATGEGSFAILGSDDHAQKVKIEIGAEVTGPIYLGTGKGDTMNNGDGDVVTIDMMSSSIAAAYSITGAEKINTLVGGEKVMLPTLSGPNGLMVLSDLAMTGFATGRAALRWTTGHIHRLVARQMAAPERLAEGAGRDAGAPVRETWGLLLSGRAERNENGLAAWKHGLGGAVIGHSAPLPGGWRGGLFAGLGFGRTETVKSNFWEDIDRVFVGAHGRRRLGDFAIGGSLLVGNAAHDGARAVNNMSNGVRETAVGAYDGFWFSPSLAVEWSHGLGNGFVLRPSARISYAREARDGYTESGASSANLIVKGRAVDVVDGRLQLELSKSFAAGARGASAALSRITAMIVIPPVWPAAPRPLLMCLATARLRVATPGFPCATRLRSVLPWPAMWSTRPHRAARSPSRAVWGWSFNFKRRSVHPKPFETQRTLPESIKFDS